MKSSKLNSKKQELIADKELFRLWYEFYRIAVNSTDKSVQLALRKSASFYKSWGKDPSLHFDDWWITHKSLFVDSNRVRLAKDAQGDGTLVFVPKGKSETALISEFRDLISHEKSLLGLTKRKKAVSHLYSPSEVQGVKREALRMMLGLQQQVFCNDQLKGADLLARVIKYFSSERYKRKANKVPASFQIGISTSLQDHHDEAMRNVRRYRQKAKKLVMNVASGVFPGDY